MKRDVAGRPDLHVEAQRNRLLAANRAQADHIVALEATMREVHSILSDVSSGNTDQQRVGLARGHLVGAIAKHSVLAAARRG